MENNFLCFLNELSFLLDNFFKFHPQWSVVISFLAGIVSSLSPCVYPLIPITIGIIGSYSTANRKNIFFASFIFVLGISTVYTTLGIISASLGLFLGKIIVSPISYSLLGVFFIFLGMAQFDIFRFTILEKFTTLNYDFKKTLLSLFLMGALSALAMTPCIFPILGSILAMISVERNILYGGLNLFSFSLGYGTILLIIGVFMGFISKLPKTGLWLIIVKRCIGILLLGIGGVFLVKAFVLFLY